MNTQVFERKLPVFVIDSQVFKHELSPVFQSQLPVFVLNWQVFVMDSRVFQCEHSSIRVQIRRTRDKFASIQGRTSHIRDGFTSIQYSSANSPYCPLTHKCSWYIREYSSANTQVFECKLPVFVTNSQVLQCGLSAFETNSQAFECSVPYSWEIRDYSSANFSYSW